MAKYECKVCGYIYNEQHAGRSFSEINECPICNEGKENFFKLDEEENNNVAQVVNKVEEVKEDSSIEQSAPFASVVEETKVADAVEETVSAVEEKVADVVGETVPAVEEKVADVVGETVSVAEEKVADVVEETVSVAEEKVADVVEEAAPVVANVWGSVTEEPKVEETPEFVVEKRQEFWSPFSGQSQNLKAESTNTTGWTISNARTAVETVLDENGDKKVESVASTAERVKNDMPAYESRIEHFYSSAEAVGTSHIVSEEKETFKPLWNTTGGTVQRVIDPFGDKKEPVVKAENIGMVVPAEEPVVEEILGEEPEDVVEEVKEDAVGEAEPVAEETVKETAEEADEKVAAEEITADVVEAPIVEEVKEAMATKDMTSVYASGYSLWDDEEDDDDDFFTEVTLDAVVEDVPEERDADIISEDVVEKEISFLDEEEAEAIVKEAVAEEAEAIVEEATEEAVAEEAEAIVEEATEEVVAGEAEAIVEEATEEAAAEEAEAIVEEATEEVVAEEAEEIVSDIAEEITEEPVSEPVNDTVEAMTENPVEEPAEEHKENEAPRVKAWSFLDDIVEASTVAGATAAGVAGVTFVTKAMDEVVEAEVTEDDIEEVFVDFGDENVVENVYKTNLAEELFGAQPVSKPEVEETLEEVAEVDESIEEVAVAEDDEAAECIAEEVAYNNNLEKILILPAQLNPMPLPADTYVESRTILGIASEKPLVLDSPVFTAGMYNMVQYIPNTGLTSEDYQNADAIEIIVGHGNGIEKTINSKEDLRQVVNFLRLEADGCPIGIKLGAARIERDLEFCIFAKPDYVVLNNFSVVPLPYALHRAMKFLNTVQSDIDIVIALDGVKDGEELAKVFAMGADLVALRNQPADMDGLVEDLKQYARITGHYDVEDLNVKDLCTTDREIAEYTDIYHV